MADYDHSTSQYREISSDNLKIESKMSNDPNFWKNVKGSLVKDNFEWNEFAHTRKPISLSLSFFSHLQSLSSLSFILTLELVSLILTPKLVFAHSHYRVGRVIVWTCRAWEEEKKEKREGVIEKWEKRKRESLGEEGKKEGKKKKKSQNVREIREKEISTKTTP